MKRVSYNLLLLCYFFSIWPRNLLQMNGKFTYNLLQMRNKIMVGTLDRSQAFGLNTRVCLMGFSPVLVLVLRSVIQMKYSVFVKRSFSIFISSNVRWWLSSLALWPKCLVSYHQTGLEDWTLYLCQTTSFVNHCKCSISKFV